MIFFQLERTFGWDILTKIAKYLLNLFHNFVKLIKPSVVHI